MPLSAASAHRSNLALRWMPAHTSTAAIGVAKDSNGHCITLVDWRANSLADALAKHAALQHRVPAKVTKTIDAAAETLEFYAARLGAVTSAANHYKVATVLPDGVMTYTTKRDSTAVKPQQRQNATRKRKLHHSEATCTGTQDANTRLCIPLEVPCASRPNTTNTRKRRLRFRQHWLANKKHLKPAELGSAQRRLAELREGRCQTGSLQL